MADGSNNNRDFLQDFGAVKVNKIQTKILGENKKIAYVLRRRVVLQDYKPDYGVEVKMLDEVTVKRQHLGKIKCVMKFKTDDELKNILTKYFV